MTSSPHGPYGRASHVIQWSVQRVANPRGELIHKADRSPDRSLQLDCVKSESLVIVDQHVTVNTFPVLYTPPVTPWEWGSARSS